MSENRLTHVNQIRLTYHEIVGPWSDADRRPRNTLVMLATPPVAGVDLDSLRETVEGQFRPDFLLDQTVHHTSWGADGTVVDFLLQAAAGGIVGGAAWDAIKTIAKQIVALHKDPPTSRPIDETEAEGWARQLAARHFGEVTELQLRRLRLEPPGATVVFEGSDGSVISIELEVVDNLIVMGSIEREFPV
ncbi:hypothetical protein [Gordonia terrae]|nr:hypothetical protein [Gordonia terrae]